MLLPKPRVRVPELASMRELLHLSPRMRHRLVKPLLRFLICVCWSQEFPHFLQPEFPTLVTTPLAHPARGHRLSGTMGELVGHIPLLA